jgi:DNA-binding winged helix-turn-helix (wHTH) protein
VSAGTLYAFDDVEVDSARRRVTRGDRPIGMPSRHLDVLLHLLSSAGVVVSKDTLIEVAWRGIAVTDNSLEQAISALRRALDAVPGQPSCIRTVPRQGYCFDRPVARRLSRASDASLDALLAPHRAWIEGRAALETLGRTEILRARHVFEQAIQSGPDQSIAHIGLANACIMHFEMTRADVERDYASLHQAESHAREACRLDPGAAEAWATLGFVLDRSGQPLDALAAVRRALELEPDNWRHHFRHGLVSWGEERLRAARRSLALLPGFPLAHWLAATVHVARQAFDDAGRELSAGVEGLSAPPLGSTRFSAVALHWLDGLVRLARGDRAGARVSLERELADEGSGHLYARECCANAWYAIGALHLGEQNLAEAASAFRQALERVPGHPMARVGLMLGAAVGGPATGDAAGAAATASALEVSRLPPIDAALARAALAGSAGAVTLDAAVNALNAELVKAAAGQAGWIIPVEPLLNVASRAQVWRPVLATLRARAA